MVGGRIYEFGYGSACSVRWAGYESVALSQLESTCNLCNVHLACNKAKATDVLDLIKDSECIRIRTGTSRAFQEF
ncbi:MAG: hypothetical protein QOF63_1372 [Thermoanaerobaculia bacterium]|nr:hypothetical protein [Thermoanaerobaculia bacterium]